MAKQHVRTWDDYEGELPRPLNILVYRRGGGVEPFHAHCIQYSGVYARGETQEAAIEEALNLLLHHLYECQVSETRPMRASSQIYLDAFFTGETVRIAGELKNRIPVQMLVRDGNSRRVVIRTTHDKAVVGD